MDLSLLADRFVSSCEVRGLSRHSLRAYRLDLRFFLAYVGAQTRPDAVDKDRLQGWLTDLRGRGLAPTSIRRRFACLRAFYRWLEEEGLCLDNPFHGFRLRLAMPKRLPRHLKAQETAALVAGMEQDQEGAEGFRRQTLSLAVMLMLTTGLRISEVCHLTLADIDLADRSLAVHGKGNRERRVFLIDAALVEECQAYLRQRAIRAPRCERLLVTERGGPVQPDYIRRLLHRTVDALGLERRITPHMLRHTAATRLLEAGVDIRLVQKLLGHSSIAVTEIYTHVADNQLRQAVCRAEMRRHLVASEVS